MSATTDHFSQVLGVISITYTRAMLINTALSCTDKNYLLKPFIYTIFGYQSVNQPVSDPYLNLQIQVSFSKMADSDSQLIHVTGTWNLQIITYR